MKFEMHFMWRACSRRKYVLRFSHPWLAILSGCWLGAGALAAQIVAPAPPPPDAFLLGNKSRKIELNVLFDSTGKVQKVNVQQSCGVPRLDRDTASFIRANWHRADCAGRSLLVPIIFNPPPFLPRPPYPKAAWKTKPSGTVFFTVNFNRDGRVSSVQVTRSSGHPELDQGLIKFVTEYWTESSVPDTEPAVRAIQTSAVFLYLPGPGRSATQDTTPDDLRQLDSQEREGILSARYGNENKARALFEKLLAEKPDNPQVLFFYGAALFDLGHYQEALSQWQPAFATWESESLGDKTPLSHFLCLAICHWATGDTRQAYALCAEAAKAYPNVYWDKARVRLGDLKATNMANEMLTAWYKSETQ